MRNTLINVKEAYDMGLNLGEINEMVSSVYEELVKEAIAKGKAERARKELLIAAKHRVFEDRYTADDLELLRQNLPSTPKVEEARPAKGLRTKSVRPKKVHVSELEDWLKSLGVEPTSFF